MSCCFFYRRKYAETQHQVYKLSAEVLVLQANLENNESLRVHQTELICKLRLENYSLQTTKKELLRRIELYENPFSDVRKHF